MRDLSLNYEPLDDLLKAVRSDNPKLHDLHALDASFDRFGYVTPIVVNDADGKVLEGHGRLEALKKLRASGARPPDGIRTGPDGSWLVPVVRGANLSEQQAAAFLIAANRITELGGWDHEALAALLASLESDGFGLDGTGFTADDLDALLENLGQAESKPVPDPDEAEELPPAREVHVRAGDVYHLGAHVVACGDARDRQLLASLLPGEQADVLCTDPPYGVSFTGSGRRKLTIANDNAEGLERLLEDAFLAADSVLRPGAALYVAHPAGPLAAVFMQAFSDGGWQLRQSLIWVKDALVLGRSDYHYRHEPILYGFKPGQGRHGRGAKGWFGDDSASSVLEYPRPRSSKHHPTMKPVGLITDLLRNSSRRGDLVLDPFLGSGTTLIACERLGRRCVAVELDPRYVQVALNRWQDLTGHTPARVTGDAA